MMDCDHDWRGKWRCNKCREEDRRGPPELDRALDRIAELEAALMLAVGHSNGCLTDGNDTMKPGCRAGPSATHSGLSAQHCLCAEEARNFIQAAKR